MAVEDKTYEFVVPPNVKPGEKLKMKFPGASEGLIVTIPQDAVPGQKITFSTSSADGMGAAVAKGKGESTYAAEKLQARFRGNSARTLVEKELIPAKNISRVKKSSATVMLLMLLVAAGAAAFFYQEELMAMMAEAPPPPPPKSKFLGVF